MSFSPTCTVTFILDRSAICMHCLPPVSYTHLALARRGLACAAFKCGPDYIDPLFHRRVVGARSGNLDGFFTDAPTLRALLARGAAGADVAVLEGVMGFYDGMAPGVADASSYQVARDTETPVVLVVNGRGASLSLAAVIRGIAEFLPCANVRGVVLNKTSAAACALSLIHI